MKYQVRQSAAADTLQLQSIGHVIGQPAANVKVGNVLMWNFGQTSTVLEIVKTTPSFIVVKTESKGGYVGERKLKKSRLVCILQD